MESRASSFIEKSIYIDDEGIETLTATEAHFACKVKELETLEFSVTATSEEVKQRIAILKKETKSK